MFAHMSAALLEILAEADGLLEPERFEDYCVNGLQVPGGETVQTLASGVSANLSLFERAAAEGAQLLVVHHGLFWGSGVRAIDPPLRRRLAALLESGIALAAYHLPLDAHLEIGNNALLARALGASDLSPFATHRNQPIGVLATLPADGIPARGEQGLFARVEDITDQEPLVFDAGPEQIHTIAIVAGAGTSHLPEAIAAGADAFVTGEPAERAMAEANEAGIHFVAAGHHATETFGVRALGEHLAKRFDLRHRFIDVRNPI